MPPDWDEDSLRLRRNLTKVLRQILTEGKNRRVWTSESVRQWHAAIMAGLDLAPGVQKTAVGKFRGERGLERICVKVGPHQGTAPGEVAAALARFDDTFRASVIELDGLMPAGAFTDSETLLAVLDVCAWVHAEWVRIHPFVNGNGRTARILGNAVAMRYGLPPFIRLRPRPDGTYGAACHAAMQGNWRPMGEAFARMLRDTLKR